MKYKKIALAVVPVVAAGLMGTHLVSAAGFGMFEHANLSADQIAQNHQQMFEKEASFLGIGVDEVKNGWAQGKSLFQIAQEHGITKVQLQQKMKDAYLAEAKIRFQALVDKGIITQAQADQRLSFLTSKSGKGFGHRMIGKHM
jgi:hypothetical protein